MNAALDKRASRFDVALVYPPFGPAGLPSLGLALLSAAIKARGHMCRTFYWNFDLALKLPGDTVAARFDAYRSLSGRTWHPFNEWVFSEALYGDSARMRQRDAETELELRHTDGQNPGSDVNGQTLLDLRKQSSDLIASMLKRLEPFRLVGIATTFYQNVPALALAKRIKQVWPDKIVVLGGANCDGEMGQGLMRLFDFVDYICSGEVDHVFPEFVDRLSLGQAVDDMPGVLRRDGEGRPQASQPAPPLQDLEALPFPDFDDYVEERKRVGLHEQQEMVLALESSRGCWWGEKHHCTFCGLNAGGIGYRQKSQARFQREVTAVTSRYGSRFLFMTDNILSMDYYGQFMDWARQANLNVDFFYEIKSNAKRSHVARLAAAGITAVQPGIESFNTSVLSLMRKGVTGIQNVAFLKYAREYGVLTSYNLLVGFPGEDPLEYDALIDQLPALVHLRPPTSIPTVEYHRFSPYHQNPESFGISLRPSATYQRLYPFPDEEIARIAYLFERAGDQPGTPAYLPRLAQAIMRWRLGYREDGCTLTWREERGQVLVDDCRPGFRQKRYRLKRFACHVFHELDAPASLGSLTELARASLAEEDLRDFMSLILDPQLGVEDDARDSDETIDFTARDFLARPEECLEPLVEGRLLYVEKAGQAHQRFLALPVSERRKRGALQWLDVGV